MSYRWCFVPAGAIMLCVFGWAAGPASAYEDLSGVWMVTMQQDVTDPAIGDYTGLPINDAARLRADSYSPEQADLPEWQCRQHPVDYASYWGPIRLWEQRDRQTQQLVAIRMHLWNWGSERTIWMDGRAAPPPYFEHTTMGFSVGKWDGEILNVTVSNVNEAFLRRNYIPRSDRASITEQFIRHGNDLTLTDYIQDPAYLTAPVLRMHDYVRSPNLELPPYPCQPELEVVYPKKNFLPTFLPGNNTLLRDFAKTYHLPVQAARGVQAALYPQYRKQLPALARADRNQKGVPSASMGVPGSKVAVATAVAGDDGGADGKVHVVPVRANVFMLVGPGGDVTVQTGSDGVLIVNTMSAQAAPEVLEAIRHLSSGTLYYIVNTNYLPDETGGNPLLREAGRTVVGGNETDPGVANFATVIGQANMLLRMSAEKAPSSPVAAALRFPSFMGPNGAWPSDGYLGDNEKFYFNNEGIDIEHAAAASTDGDSFVYFPRSDVISTGEIFDMTRYPIIDVDAGGSVQGEIDALWRIAAMMIPVYGQAGGTLAIPAHGRLCNKGDVVNYRDMVTVVAARVQRMVDQHMTLQQVLAARPTRDYDPLYGADSGPWTTNDFVSAVYRSLARASSGAGRRHH